MNWDLTKERRIEQYTSDYYFWKRRYEKTGNKYARARMNNYKHRLWMLDALPAEEMKKKV